MVFSDFVVYSSCNVEINNLDLLKQLIIRNDFSALC